MDSFDKFERCKDLMEGLVEWASGRINEKEAFKIIELYDSGVLKSGLAFNALKSASDPLYLLLEN